MPEAGHGPSHQAARRAGSIRRGRPSRLLVAVAGAVALLTIAPLIQLAVRAIAGDPAAAWENTWRDRTAVLLANSLALAFTVTIGCLVIGIALAWLVTRVKLPGRQLWWIAACLPLAVPSFVGAFAWRATWPTVHGFWPLALVLIVTLVPYVTAPTMSAFVLADHTQAHVARTLGSSPTEAWWRVTLPQVLPAALAGALLVALYTLGDFGSPAILRFQTLTTGIYAQFTGGFDRALAASSALLLAGVALVFVVVERRARKRAALAERSAAARTAAPEHAGSGIRATAMLAVILVSGAGTLGPTAALVARWVQSDRYASEASDLVMATASSLGVGLIAAAVATAAAIPIAYLAARYGNAAGSLGRTVRGIESASYIGQALPGLVVAIALVALSLQFAAPLYQTLAILVAAYIILFLSKAIGSSRAAIVQVARGAEDASRASGFGPFATWRRITLPLALPGISVGFLLVTLAVMKELPATLMLRPTGFDTLATELWSKTSIGAYGAGAPIGIILMLVGIVPAILVARSVGRVS